MITDLGKVHIKRFLAGWEPELAASIAFGVGDSTPTGAQDRLDYEIGRSDIILTSYDFLEDKVIFKGVMDELFDGVIYEVGLYSSEAEGGKGGSRLLLSFDSDTETWTQDGVAATYVTTATRIGNDSVQVTPAAGATATVSHTDILMDISGHTSADTFSFAFYTANTNVQTIVYRLYTDNINYYDITVPAASIVTGFNIVNIPMSQAAATGAPRWDSVTRVDVIVIAKAAGAVNLQLEAIRLEDKDNSVADNILIARTKLAVPFVKLAGTIQEVEFPLGVTL